MPTELFIRRPLLWLTFATRKRASILCSPNFGYKHYLKVLGERPIEGLDLSPCGSSSMGPSRSRWTWWRSFSRACSRRSSRARHVPGVWTGGSLTGHDVSAARRGRIARCRSSAASWAWAAPCTPSPRRTRMRWSSWASAPPFLTAKCASPTMTMRRSRTGESATSTSAGRTSRRATSRIRRRMQTRSRQMGGCAPATWA